jgi:hypothetical protein
MSRNLYNWRPTARTMVFSGLAGAGMLLAAWQPGSAQVRRDVDPDRPPVTPPAAPPVEPELRRGLPPEATPATETPATRPATMMTFTGKAALIESDDDKVTLLIDDTEEKSFTVADNAKITLNSKPARLRDIQSGDVLKIVTHKAEPSVAQSIVAARVTETSEDSGNPPRYSVADTEGPKGGTNSGQSSYANMRSAGVVGAVMPFQGRVFVMQIQDGTPAAELGFQPGDTILIVGANGMLPTNTNIQGGRVDAAQLQSGLVVVPPGTVGGNAAGGTIQGGAVRGATGVVPGNTGVVPFVGPGIFPGSGIGTDNGNNQNGNNQNGNNQNGNNQNGNNGNATGTGTSGTRPNATNQNRGPVTPGAGAANADRNTQGTGGRTGTTTPGSGAATGGSRIGTPRTGGTTP